jgi:hypothetical protein
MSDAITGILTDTSMRSEDSIGQALFSDATIYSAWFN